MAVTFYSFAPPVASIPFVLAFAFFPFAASFDEVDSLIRFTVVGRPYLVAVQ